MDGQEMMYKLLLDSWKVGSKQGYFKLAILNNHIQAYKPPFDTNPLAQLWMVLKFANVPFVSKNNK
jgi:hypothetical protein